MAESGVWPVEVTEPGTVVLFGLGVVVVTESEAGVPVWVATLFGP